MKNLKLFNIGVSDTFTMVWWKNWCFYLSLNASLFVLVLIIDFGVMESVLYCLFFVEHLK